MYSRLIIQVKTTAINDWNGAFFIHITKIPSFPFIKVVVIACFVVFFNDLKILEAKLSAWNNTCFEKR